MCRGEVMAQPLTILFNGQRLAPSDWVDAPVLNLPAREKSIIIRIQCRKPQQTFEYRLQQDQSIAWQSFTNEATIHYENLSGSEYVFQLREPNKKPFIERKVFIENAIWQSWWFIPSLFLYIVLVVSVIVYFFFRFRYRQQVRLMRVRDRIARDLHDDMGSYLSSISILSQTASRSVTKDPAKAQATLDRIGQTARQVMDSMGDIVWSINPDHDSMKQVVSRMTDVASGLFGADNELIKQVTLQVDVADDVCQMSLSTERRRDFFLIYKEAITNAARYANATRVRVQLSREGGQLVLVIDDNGDGFDPDKPERRNSAGGNGLNNMRKRAELLGGVLLIRSATGEGTTLSLKFPV